MSVKFSTSIVGLLVVFLHSTAYLLSPDASDEIYTGGSDNVRTMQTLVMTTISSRGKLNFLIAFPRISSETPLEYICTFCPIMLSGE